MAVVLANRSQFVFAGATYTATSVSISAPTPEVINMTSASDPLRTIKIVPTGDYTSPGSIEVECLGFSDPTALIGVIGQATLSTRAGAISRNVLCESASVQAEVGALLRLRFSLTPTDYVPPS
jgi:hypothetical protein